MHRSVSHLRSGPWLALALAVGFLTHRLDAVGYFLDGQIYAALGSNVARGFGGLVPGVATDAVQPFFDHPPLVVWLEAAWFRIAGSSWIAGRVYALLWLVTLLVVLHRMVRTLAGRRIAWAATLLLALTWPVLRWSRQPNLDVPLAVFATLSLCNVWRGTWAQPQASLRPWWMAGLWFGLALWTKGYAALFLPLAVVSWLLVARGWRGLQRGGPWLALAVGLSLFTLWPAWLATQGHLDGFVAYVGRPWSTAANPWLADPGPWVLVRRLFGQALPTTLLALAGVALLLRGRDRRHPGWLFLAWAGALLIATHATRPRLPHWLVPAYPALAALGALPWPRLPWHVRRWAPRVVLAIAIVGMGLVYTLPLSGSRTPRDPYLYGSLHQVISAGIRPDCIVSLEGRYTPWLTQAAAAFPHGIAGAVISLESLEALLAGDAPPAQRLLLVLHDDEVARLTQGAQERLAAWFRAISTPPKHVVILGYIDRRLKGTR